MQPVQYKGFLCWQRVNRIDSVKRKGTYFHHWLRFDRFFRLVSHCLCRLALQSLLVIFLEWRRERESCMSDRLSSAALLPHSASSPRSDPSTPFPPRIVLDTTTFTLAPAVTLLVVTYCTYCRFTSHSET